MQDNHLAYFLENFKLAYSTHFNLNKIRIGYDESCHIQIEKFEIINPINDLKSITWKVWKEVNIPFIMNRSDKESVINEINDNQVSINFDIIEAGWYLMSGAQELDTKNNDKYGRFCFEGSIQEKLKIAQLPVVNYYFDILKEAIEMVSKTEIITNRKFSATITHDIDEVTSGWKHRIRTNLDSKNFFKVFQYGLSHLFKPFYPWKNLIELSNFDKENKVNSSFFFLCRNDKLDGIKNADYNILDSYINKSREHIAKNNQEIGIHGSYRTHDSSEELKKDIHCLGNLVVGNRFHFLQYSINETSKILDELKFNYDATLGFQETIGFRNSICTPFKLYNFETNESHNFIEIPLNIMDCSLEYENYMGLSIPESRIAVKSLIQEIKKFNGNVCINWHNTYFSDYLKTDWKLFYEELIKILKNENCKFLTCSELAEKRNS